ncbi:acyl-CoA--sterol O-acyltransferase 1-like [Dorcoceras hygrometricum]|uniref:Acyl-CoA--sterol O-acyltransferase 1-like n=1 Tax=Dorcoceras hygrometricum TaxID=472368 RepID=A0A2Z7C651_9LAMI|nr:acyl-CoA--sterol O-acyltransferase 1-like [Dorcoceras hygrometricum]
MEGEINNFILVWLTAVVSLCYCYQVGKIFPTVSKARLLAILPVSCLFLYLPLNLTSIHFGGTTSFFISWLCNFKIILFAFNKGPLSSNPPIPLSRFIPLACFPIRFKVQESHVNLTKKRDRSMLNYAIKVAMLPVFVRVYFYKNILHPKIILFCYCLHMYFMLEMMLVLVTSMAKALLRVELEQPFDEPYLSTSLQDFWGRRWNPMASNILHPTVYQPVRSASTRFVARKWAPIPAVLATFFVSGLMHELVFYNIGRLKPTGEVMAFFLLHGLSLSVEIGIKKMVKGKLLVAGFVSGPLAVAYVIYSSFWLFFPPLLRCNAELKGCTESLAFLESLKTRRLVSPSEVSCPFL